MPFARVVRSGSRTYERRSRGEFGREMGWILIVAFRVDGGFVSDDDLITKGGGGSTAIYLLDRTDWCLV